MRVPLDKLLSIVAEHLHVTEAKVGFSSTADDFLEWDSHFILTLAVELESQFGIVMAYDALPNLISIEKIIEMLAHNGVDVIS